MARTLSSHWSIPALAAALLFSVAACTDAEAPAKPPLANPPAAVPEGEGAPAEPGTDPPPAPINKEALNQRAKELHEHAWKLMQAFRGQVYDPVRDTKLARAGASLLVRLDDGGGEVRTGRYAIDFDASRRPRMQTRLEPGEGADGLPQAVQSMAYRMAATGFRGAYYLVVTHLPPTYLSLFEPKKEGKWGVYAPPDAGGPSVSYVLDEGNLVVLRGTATDRLKTIESFEWDRIATRSFLKTIRLPGADGETTFEFVADSNDLMLLERVIHRTDRRSVEFHFDYERVEFDRD